MQATIYMLDGEQNKTILIETDSNLMLNRWLGSPVLPPEYVCPEWLSDNVFEAVLNGGYACLGGAFFGNDWASVHLTVDI